MLNYQSVPQNKSANSPHHPPRLRRDASTALPRAIARGGRDAAGAAAVAGLGGVAGGLALRVATCGSMGSFTNGHPPKKNRKSP